MLQAIRDLAEQIEPDRRPAFPKTQERAAERLRHAAWLLERMAETVETDPWNDILVDWLDGGLAQARELAGRDLAIFRATRDCGGES